MLIRAAEVAPGALADLRVEDGLIVEIGELKPISSETVIEGRAGALLPGLHDHHIHMAALAAADSSVSCNAPGIIDEATLAAALCASGTRWVRALHYDERIAGSLDADRLERLVPGRPARVQHRTGRMWFLNHSAIALLLASADPPPGLERSNGRWTGRLFDEDGWLREAIGSVLPDFARVSRDLAKWGVTGVTDLTPANDARIFAHFAAQQQNGSLLQRCVVGGAPTLAGRQTSMLRRGPTKFHLHENALPEFGVLVEQVRQSHADGRPAAMHCVTEVELVFALAALADAGPIHGDRIEHAAVTPEHLVEEIARLGCHVVTQPHFITERGDRYIDEVHRDDQPWLYRLAGLARAGIILGGGSDAPYGSADPWKAMRAAVARTTLNGIVMAVTEAMTSEAALALFLADPERLDIIRKVEAGAVADLCLLDRPWAEARDRLQAADVRMTIVGGSVVYERVDKTPFRRGRSSDSSAGQDQQIRSPPAYPSRQRHAATGAWN